MERYFCDAVAVGFVAIFLVGSESDCDDFVFAHEELRVSEGLPESFEVISRHVVEGEYVEIFEPCEEGVHLVDDELFVLSGFGFDLGEGNDLIPFGFGHQQ